MKSAIRKSEKLERARHEVINEMPSFMVPDSVRELLPFVGYKVKKYDGLYYLWRQACADSLYWSNKTVLRTVPSNKDAMTWRTHGILCMLVEDENIVNLLAEFPRKHLKSSIVTSRGPYSRLMKRAVRGEDPYDRFFILSHDFGVAQRHYWELKEPFESDADSCEFFRFLFGDELKKSKKWNEDIACLVRDWHRKDMTFEPLAKKAAGKHCEWVFCDDLIDEENYDSEGAVEKAIQYFRFTRNWIEGPTDRIIVVGNRWGLADLNTHIHKIAEKQSGVDDKGRSKNWAVLSVSAENGPNLDGEWMCRNLPDYAMELLEVLKDTAEKYGSIWPERFSNRDLKDLEDELGPEIYSAQYNNQPEASGAVEFDYEKIGNGKLVNTEEGPAIKASKKSELVYLKNCNIYVGWDPATDGKHGKSKNAVVTTAYNSKGELFVIRESVKKQDPLKSALSFVAMCRLFKGYMKASCVEEVGFQRLLKKSLLKLAHFTKTFIGLRKVKTYTDKSKAQRNRLALGMLIEQELFWILDECRETRKAFRLYGVKGAVDDPVDAVGYVAQIMSKPLSEEEVNEIEELDEELEMELGITGYGSALAD